MMSEIQKHLFTLKDDKYLKFQQALCPTCKYPMIGVRTPLLRKYAKELLKQNCVIFKDEYYDEILLHGFYICGYKCDYRNKVKLVDEYLSLIDNWAVCDGFVSSLKFINKNKEQYFLKVKKFLKSTKEYEQRFALVVLLSYYMDNNYLDYIYYAISNTNYHGYYSLMAGAWLLSYCFIFYFDETLNYIKQNQIDNFVYKKGIQKSLESFRISNENKQILRNLLKQV